MREVVRDDTLCRPTRAFPRAGHMWDGRVKNANALARSSDEMFVAYL